MSLFRKTIRYRGTKTIRRCVMLNGAPHYFCRGCQQWREKDDFYALANPDSTCGIRSNCAKCDNRLRMARAQRERNRVA